MKAYFKDNNLRFAFYDDEYIRTRFIGKEMTEKNIDELKPENTSLMADLKWSLGREDENGDTKYYLDAEGDIAERDNWVELTQNL